MGRGASPRPKAPARRSSVSSVTSSTVLFPAPRRHLLHEGGCATHVQCHADLDGGFVELTQVHALLLGCQRPTSADYLPTSPAASFASARVSAATKASTWVSSIGVERQPRPLLETMT